MSGLTNQQYLDQTRLVEEVPGVPEHERWFLWRNRKIEKHFPSCRAGKEYCELHGITVDEVERFGY